MRINFLIVTAAVPGHMPPGGCSALLTEDTPQETEYLNMMNIHLPYVKEERSPIWAFFYSFIFTIFKVKLLLLIPFHENRMESTGELDRFMCIG